MTLDQFLKDVSVDLVPVQYEVLKDIIFNDNTMTILPRAGGKTLLLALAALWKAKCSKNQRICLVSPVYIQSKWVIKEVQRWAKKDAVFESGFCSVTFDNSSIITGLPINDIIKKDFDHFLVDEYQCLIGEYRDYIDNCDVDNVSIMISDEEGNDRYMELIVNRKRCYKILKYSTSDYPERYYDEDILRELVLHR